MELESETYEKYLNDDIHELPDCRISKHTVNHSVYIINPLCSEQNFIIHFSWFFWKIYLNFKNSKMCLHQVKLSVLNKWTPYVSARHRRWAWHSSKLPTNFKVLQLLYGSPAVFDSEKLARNSAGCVNIEGRRWQMNFLDFVENRRKI